MDRLLRRELARIAQDRRSGSAELALCAAGALETWLWHHRKPRQEELLEIAGCLLRVQRAMAPMLRLANEVALAAEAATPARLLCARMREFREQLRSAPQRIARAFADALRGPAKTVATYSYSSTVVIALLRARRKIRCVLVSEARPGGEGLTMAKRLAAGMRITFVSDAGLLTRVKDADALVCGADAILLKEFVNKIGTGALVSLAREARIPVWVLADSTKFLPEPLKGRLKTSDGGDSKELWRHPPRGVRVESTLFERVRFTRGVRILTEGGWRTPAALRRELHRIRVSQRLRQLTAAGD